MFVLKQNHILTILLIKVNKDTGANQIDTDELESSKRKSIGTMFIMVTVQGQMKCLD